MRAAKHLTTLLGVALTHLKKAKLLISTGGRRATAAVDEQEATDSDENEEIRPDMLVFEVGVSPVSLQSKPKARAAFDLAIETKLNSFDFLIDSQLTIQVDYFGSARRRWETDSQPDVDNWMKPLIDSLVGANRLIVDDSQIKSLGLTYHEDFEHVVRLRIEVKFDPDHTLTKQDLVFVQYPGGLCWPTHLGGDEASIEVQITGAETMLNSHESMRAAGVDGLIGTAFLMSGFIHRSRLGSSFSVLTVAEARQRAAIAPSGAICSTESDDAP